MRLIYLVKIGLCLHDLIKIVENTLINPIKMVIIFGQDLLSDMLMSTYIIRPILLTFNFNCCEASQ